MRYSQRFLSLELQALQIHRTMDTDAENSRVMPKSGTFEKAKIAANSEKCSDTCKNVSHDNIYSNTM